MLDNISVSEKHIRELLGQNLKRLRKQAGLSQLALALEADFTHKFINDIENGNKWISCRTIARLCKVFRVEPSQLFLPLSADEGSEILSAYINDFSTTIQKTVAEFKARYLSD
jgi:transcriptional regulator with XRE-family HTH domain